VALNPPIGNGADKIVARVIGPDGSEGGRGVEEEEEELVGRYCYKSLLASNIWLIPNKG
jgi:hypothetical protein